MWNYETLKQEAQRRRKDGQTCRIESLIAMARKNDPFYVGAPSELDGARWFADLWERFGYGRGVHLRRIHYQLVSQDPPVVKPNGTLYENTLNDWKYLTGVSKWARYLKLVPAHHFVDRRNPKAIVFAKWSNPGDFGYEDPAPGYDARDDADWWSYELPDLPELDELPDELPDLPKFAVKGYGYTGWNCELQQSYHVEVWAEKTTMNDVLRPVCSRYKANLITGAGELSITAVVNFLKRVRDAERSARILYISDFDPAGLGMPVSVARKIEYFQRTRGFDDLDIRLDPVVLTADQIREYSLPRVPVKDSDLRKANFEAAHGEGQVELDALEALHPGRLARIVKDTILSYYDPELNDRAESQRNGLFVTLCDKRDGVYTEFSDELNELGKDYRGLRGDFDETRERFDELVADFQEEVDVYHERLEDIKTRGRELYGKVYERLTEVDVDVDGDDYALPEPDLPAETDGLLYDARRGYFDQLECYKTHRHGDNGANGA